MPIADITIRNGTPPEWNAVIIGAACDFFYRDGTTSQDDKQGLNIPSGSGEAHCYSRDNCVGSYKIVIAVRVSNTVKLVEATYGVEEGKCITGDTVTLGKKRNLDVIEKRLGTTSTEHSFELVTDVKHEYSK
ncbi:hypothetical protein IYY11_02130 [Methylocystis sp. H62]|uniref:hypothetical protein n=1 Tax=Methylocystis sp. H62 TaxID=2785789 RepID=UPI0018C2982A|nr:hypothetical protein [Methylocystis sp. H62]MBG0792267.1 hypothetical protein [Methylocystis sp. H62]